MRKLISRTVCRTCCFRLSFRISFFLFLQKFILVAGQSFSGHKSKPTRVPGLPGTRSRSKRREGCGPCFNNMAPVVFPRNDTGIIIIIPSAGTTVSCEITTIQILLLSCDSQHTSYPTHIHTLYDLQHTCSTHVTV